MPRRDGTGPLGLGAMTGGGFGNCNSNNTRLGLGRGFGCGNGFRRNMLSHPETSRTQKDVLTEQKSFLENRLEIVNRQLESL
jgi:hypothetical protein